VGILSLAVACAQRCYTLQQPLCNNTAYKQQWLMNMPLAACSFAETKKTKKKISKAETYKIYIYKVLKQVHPDTGEHTSLLLRSASGLG
jgi:hypothetical protein